MPLRPLPALKLLSVLLPAAAAAVVDLPLSMTNGYLGVEIQLGTPPKTFVLHPDTGSASTWVHSTACASDNDWCPNSTGYTRIPYDPAASSTSVDQKKWGYIGYVSGLSVSGGIYQDVLTLSSTDSKAAQWNQTFINADIAGWRWMPNDGFLGLAFSSIATEGSQTVFESMVQSGVADEPMFGMYLGKAEFAGDKAVTNDGVLTLGGSKAEEYVDGGSAAVKKFALIPPYEIWRTSMSDLNVGGTDIPMTNTSLIFDTGGSVLYVPPSLIDSVYAAAGINYTTLMQGVPLSCSQMTSNWTFTFTAGATTDAQQTFTFTGDQMRNPGFAGNPDWCTPPFSDGSEGVFIAGTDMLRWYYSEWDLGARTVADYKPTLGLGPLKSSFIGQT